MPNGAAAASTASISATGSSASPSQETGTPCSNASAWRSGARGASKAPRVATHSDSGSGVSLDPGEMQTFTKNATLFGTTTNVATATGDVGGDICSPGVDQLTVDVLAPPPGSFYCSEPINELTMIWNGAQVVDVKAWKGSVGGVLLGTYLGVAPGDGITVAGLGSSESTWEIFLAGGAKIGESKIDPTCEDKNMNGVEDCGKNEGNGKYDLPDKINTWLLDGLKDDNDNLDCTPEFTPPPVDPCGLGPELVLLMPGLMWLHRRRLRKSA